MELQNNFNKIIKRKGRKIKIAGGDALWNILLKRQEVPLSQDARFVVGRIAIEFGEKEKKDDKTEI